MHMLDARGQPCERPHRTRWPRAGPEPTATLHVEVMREATAQAVRNARREERGSTLLANLRCEKEAQRRMKRGAHLACRVGRVEILECKEMTTSSALQTRRSDTEQGTEEFDLRPGAEGREPAAAVARTPSKPRHEAFICRPL
jgi:hypothetical protein